MNKTLYEKIWDAHAISEGDDGFERARPGSDVRPCPTMLEGLDGVDLQLHDRPV